MGEVSFQLKRRAIGFLVDGNKALRSVLYGFFWFLDDDCILALSTRWTGNEPPAVGANLWRAFVASFLSTGMKSSPLHWTISVFFRTILSKLCLYRSRAVLSFSCVSGITLESHFFHFSLKCTGPLYSVRKRDAAIGSGGFNSTGSNGGTDVDFWSWILYA